MSAMKITFENKAAIQNDASVARKNKVADEDMNEIKQVVNNNADEVTTMQENIEDLQNGQGTASADITSLKNRVSTLETDNTQNKSDISELQSDNETNKANISSLQEQFSNFENYDDTEIKEDIKNLQSNDIIQDELISKLKSVALNAETEESKSLHVTDANKFGQLEVLGNHEQKTRDGYNILPNNLTNTTINGVTFTINEDKSVTVNGTATASIIANLITGEYNDNNATEPLIIPDNITNCRLSGCPSGGSNSTYKLDIYNQKYELLATDWGEGTNVTIDSQEDKKIARVRIIIYSGATVNNLTFKPMLVAGTEEKPYEQYGASPSPEYPSKIVCLGSNKQLFNKDDMNTLQGYIDGSGSIIYNTSNKIAYIECPKNTDITVSGKYLRGIACYNQLPTYSLQTSVKNINQATYLTLNTGDNTYLAVWYYENNSGYTEQEIIDSIKVEEGTEATSYSPYGQGSTEIKMKNADETQEKSYTLPIQQEMLSGDCFVKESDGWKEVHNYPKTILTGTEADSKFYYIKNGVGVNRISCNMGNGIKTPADNNEKVNWIYSNCFLCNNLSPNDLWGTSLKSRMSISPDGEILMTVDDNITSISLFKSLLQEKNNEGNPIYFFAKTTTPTKLPCTEEQSAVLEELSNLDLFEGVNNIITAEDIALLKLKYALDVKTYVDNKLNTINQQILEIVGGN